MFAVALLLTGCTTQVGGYLAASSISKEGFAHDTDAFRGLDGQEVKLWGYVDHGNLYSDEGVRLILGEWWSGVGPDADTWRFNRKAVVDGAAGHSFEVRTPDDAGRDALLAAFVADAHARKPTPVFVTGRLSTFDAPANTATLTGLWLEVASSQDILLAPPQRAG